MIITLTGPSGIGKGFVKDRILEHWPEICELQWATTRKKRTGETSKNRICVTDEEFEQLIQEGRVSFVQVLYGSRYGLMLSSLNTQKTYLTELHIENLGHFTASEHRVISIAMVADTIDFLGYRLRFVRKTESEEQIRARVEAAQKEQERILFTKGLFHRVFVVSQNTEDSIVSDIILFISTELQRSDK